MTLRTVPAAIDVLMAIRPAASDVFWVQLADILEAMGSNTPQITLIMMNWESAGRRFEEEAVSRVHTALVEAGIITPARRVRSA